MPPQEPCTPPRKQPASPVSSSPWTPKSISRHRPSNPHRNDGSFDSPFVQPKSQARSSRPLLLTSPRPISPGKSIFLPTPSTVGSGRRARTEIPLSRPSPKSKPLLLKLRELAEPSIADVTLEPSKILPQGSRCAVPTPPAPELPILPNALSLPPSKETEGMHSGQMSPFEDSKLPDVQETAHNNVLKDASRACFESDNTPWTPLQNPVADPKSQLDSFFDSDDEDSLQAVDFDFLAKIPRFAMPNPFLDNHPVSSKNSSRPPVDYSTHLELYNHRTGERKVERLSDREMTFRPRKLDFTSDVNTCAGYRMADKYLEAHMGDKFTSGVKPSKGNQEFTIYTDSDLED